MSDYITEGTLIMIFSRLSVKSLLRFRSVCKGWKELIDSPFFIKEHLSVQKPCFILQIVATPLQDYYYVVDPELPLLNHLDPPIGDNPLLFCGTHHGLVCLFEESNKFKIPDKLLVWNPSIRKSLAVRIPHYSQCGWAFEEGLSWFGFWVDPCTKEYKFILLTSMLEQVYRDGDYDVVIKGVKARLYSSNRPKTHNWIPIKSPEEEIGDVMLGPPILIQEVAHWSGYKYGDNARIILSFDFALEKLDTIDMPDHLRYASTSAQSTASQSIHSHWQGNLSLLVGDLETCGKYSLFARKEDAWIKMFNFMFSPNSCKFCWLFGKDERGRAQDANSTPCVYYDSEDGVGSTFETVDVAYDFVESLLFP